MSATTAHSSRPAGLTMARRVRFAVLTIGRQNIFAAAVVLVRPEAFR